MGELADYVDDLPNLCGSEPRIEAAVAAGRARPVSLERRPGVPPVLQTNAGEKPRLGAIGSAETLVSGPTL